MFDTIYRKAGAAFLAGWLSWSGTGCLGPEKVTDPMELTDPIGYAAAHEKKYPIAIVFERGVVVYCGHFRNLEFIHFESFSEESFGIESIHAPVSRGSLIIKYPGGEVSTNEGGHIEYVKRKPRGLKIQK